jgi:hypothetical protein
MISYDFRHLPTLFPPYRTLKSTCIFIYLPFSHIHAYMHMQKDWNKTQGILFFVGGWGTRTDLTSHFLGRHLLLEPSPSAIILMGPFTMVFHEQFGWRWL